MNGDFIPGLRKITLFLFYLQLIQLLTINSKLSKILITIAIRIT